MPAVPPSRPPSREGPEGPSAGSAAPLPERLRPTAFDDLLGQERIWAKDSALRRLVETDRYSALLFWGPPGSGKTSLATLIARAGGRPVAALSAVTHGVKDIREHIAESEGRLARGETATLMFMDEIHRLSRSQQDVLLPALEKGTVKFVGATTENPSFEVNAAILSRTIVFRFERLGEAALVRIMEKALASPVADLPRVDVAPEVLAAIARAADGDARRALNLLDAVIVSAPSAPAGGADTVAGPISLASLQAAGAAFALNYDRQGDQHYDTISAFIKSIRASQPDAAVYYLARMVEAGEDPDFIARRLMISASEDVGNANPTALLVAAAAAQAAHQVGMPEARIILAQATTYLAASPKSNRAYVAINAAMEDVRAHGALEIPLFLRNAPTKLMKEFGYGAGYVYAHDDHARAQGLTYLPAELAKARRRYYEPSEHGTEAQIKKNLDHLARQAPSRESQRDSKEGRT